MEGENDKAIKLRLEVLLFHRLHCKACGRTFYPDRGIHYVVAEDNGLSGAFTGKLYFDAMNCPYCECQNIIGERLPETAIPGRTMNEA